MTAKIRTAIATLTAAVSFAVAVAPAAHATMNDGRYDAYQKAHAMGDSSFCQHKAIRYDNALKFADNQARRNGRNSDEAARAYGYAVQERTDASNSGCKWA